MDIPRRCPRCADPWPAEGEVPSADPAVARWARAHLGGDLCAACVATVTAPPPPSRVVVRTYRETDRAACMACFDSNLPEEFFAPHERDEFTDYLDGEVYRFPYYVVEDVQRGAVLGCGGHWVYDTPARDSVLVWGMIHRAHHREGLGRLLLAHRLAVMGRVSRCCRLDTTPRSFGFYQRMGFVQTGYEPDGYAPGIHKVLAERPLP